MVKMVKKRRKKKKKEKKKKNTEKKKTTGCDIEMPTETRDARKSGGYSVFLHRTAEVDLCRNQLMFRLLVASVFFDPHSSVAPYHISS